jgi:hypothetical protein
LAALGRGAAGFAFGALLAVGGNVDLANFPKTASAGDQNT